MNTNIFYFTGTGNSLKVARDLAAELKDCTLTNLAKVINNNLDLSADSIGIIFPVYMFGMPLIIRQFIKKLKSASGDKYFFAIATCGGGAGSTLINAAKDFSAVGLKLNSGFIIKMPGNYTPLYGAIPVDKQNKMFLDEKKMIFSIAAAINRRESLGVQKDMPLVRGLFSLLYKVMSSKIPAMDASFWSDDKCNGCQVCSKVCPVLNIDMINGKPRWLHHCQQCFACLQWCPQEAVQYGKSTVGRKRYRNPDIKLEELL